MDNVTDAAFGNFTENNHTVRLFIEITEETYYVFQYILYVLINPSLCLIGFAGNGLGLVVLGKEGHQQKLPINVYMWALTLFDSAYLLLGVIRGVHNVTGMFYREAFVYIEKRFKTVFLYLDLVTSYTASALIVVMATERLTALCRPLTVKNLILSRYPQTIIFVCFSVNVIFLLPFLLSVEIVPYQNYANETFYIYQIVGSMMDSYVMIQALVYNYIPVIILIAINVAIPLVYRRILKVRTRTFGTSLPEDSHQIKITTVVCVITIMYCLMCIPDLFGKTLVSLEPIYYEETFIHNLWLILDIGKTFNYLNAANDFVIYILVSDNYRRTFMNTFCPKKKVTGSSGPTEISSNSRF